MNEGNKLANEVLSLLEKYKYIKIKKREDPIKILEEVSRLLSLYSNETEKEICETIKELYKTIKEEKYEDVHKLVAKLEDLINMEMWE